MSLLLKSGMDVNWTTILAGWRDDGPLGRLVRPEEVISYAADQLVEETLKDSDAVVRLATAEVDETEQITYWLGHLANQERCDTESAVRKWRVILLEQLLDRLPVDPLQRWLELMNFWSDFGFPADAAFLLQRLDTAWREGLTIHTTEPLIAEHRRWATNEKELLTE